MKVLGWYVMKDGEQIGWYRSKASAVAYAKKHGGTIVAERS